MTFARLATSLPGLRRRAQCLDRVPRGRPSAARRARRRLGSVELLPVHLLLQWRPRRAGAVHPYLGAGGNLTVCWEKSGVLDSTDLSPSVGPALQVGVDLDLSPSALLNLDIKWNAMRTNVESGETRIARLTLDPLAQGLGLGFRF